VLKRDPNPMSDEVREALRRRQLMDAHEDRPPCQRNDCGGTPTNGELTLPPLDDCSRL